MQALIDTIDVLTEGVNFRWLAGHSVSNLRVGEHYKDV